MDFDRHESCFGHALPPVLVSLSPFTSSASSSSRRLLNRFQQPRKPMRAKRQLAWLSLQGRLVGADEASSAKTIDKKGVLSVEEAETWDIFTPIQRVLIVAVVAAAAMNSKKNRQILELQKSVELRDQVLLNMQQKLDCLCKEFDCFRDQPEILVSDNVSFPTPNDSLANAPKEINADDVFKYRIPLLSEVEPEERRMSDLSDWAPSVTSSVDVQLDASANNHQTINNLRIECEEKECIIKELSTFLHKSEAFGSKRISELEDVISRKNMIINKLRKEILILEQKVVSLTRVRRPSFVSPSSNVEHLPIMAENVLYDMDSTTGASSSDSDSNYRENIVQSLKRLAISVQVTEKDRNEDQQNNQVQSSTVMVQQHQRLRKTRPLKQKPLHQTHKSVPPLKPQRTTYASKENRSRITPSKLQDVAAIRD